MTALPNGYSQIPPATTLERIASQVPESCRKNLIVVGSLAVGYRYFGDQTEMVVRTKDADCLVSPYVKAVDVGSMITNELLTAGWTPKEGGEFSEPGTPETPDSMLPVPRLNPPDHRDWFLELLTVPPSPEVRGRHFTRITTSVGDFGLASFGFIGLTDFDPIETPFGISVARPDMMALANLLEHPFIRPETMSSEIAGREMKRTSKDLGRVLAIAHLATSEDPDALEEWPQVWLAALRERFPDDWRKLAATTGTGMEELLADGAELADAHFTCVNGLLSSAPPGVYELAAAGMRLIQDAIEPLAMQAEASMRRAK